MKSMVSGSSATCVCETGSATDSIHEGTRTGPQIETVTMETGTTVDEMNTEFEGSGDELETTTITDGSGDELETTTITDGSGAETDPTEVTGTSTSSLKATTQCVCVNATTLSHKTTG